MDVPTAMVSVLAENEQGEYSIIDFIKNQQAVSEYYVGYGWFGSALTYMEPGVGYVMHAIGSTELVYPDPSDWVGSRFFDDNSFSYNQEWEINVHDYQYNGTIIASVEIDGVKANSASDQLAVFVGDECRGVVNATYVPFTGEYAFLLMAYSNELEEKMSLSFYDSATGSIYNDVMDVNFINDMRLGSAMDAMDVSFTASLEGPSSFMIGEAYPNPFNPSTSLTYYVGAEGNISLSVYDINGRLIKELANDYKSVGEYSVTWNAGNNSSGVYFVRFNADGFTQTQKIMLVK